MVNYHYHAYAPNTCSNFSRSSNSTLVEIGKRKVAPPASNHSVSEVKNRMWNTTTQLHIVGTVYMCFADSWLCRVHITNLAASGSIRDWLRRTHINFLDRHADLLVTRNSYHFYHEFLPVLPWIPTDVTMNSQFYHDFIVFSRENGGICSNWH